MRRRKYRRYKRWTWEEIYIMNIAQRMAFLIVMAHAAKVLFNDDSLWRALRSSIDKALMTEEVKKNEASA